MESASSSPLEHPTGAAETPPPKKRNKKNAPLPFDGRFAIGRRVRQLVREFRRRLGPEAAGDLIMAAAVRRCAETVALSEDLRARLLRGEQISADDALRMTRAAEFLTRRLQLDRHAPPPTESGLAGLLKQDQERQRAARRGTS